MSFISIVGSLLPSNHNSSLSPSISLSLSLSISNFLEEGGSSLMTTLSETILNTIVIGSNRESLAYPSLSLPVSLTFSPSLSLSHFLAGGGGGSFRTTSSSLRLFSTLSTNAFTS